MLDSTLRPVKDRLLSPLARGPVVRMPPLAVSAGGLALTLTAAVAASRRLAALAVVLFLVGRIADGLDGLVARRNGRDSDLGGLVDIVFDVTGYAAIPLGIAVAVDDRATWIATAVLLATFYVNVTTWAYLSSILEKRSLGADRNASATAVEIPRGLVEGTETIVFFVVALALPDAASTIWWIMAAAVAITAAERVRWAAGALR
jgi:phosphatidylglycerophosphate synthase